ELAEGTVRVATLLGGTGDIATGAQPVNWRENRESLDMVPVDVGDQRGAGEAAVERLGLTEETEPGSEVEDDRLLALDFERDTGRVAPVSHVRFAWTGAGAPHSVKRELHATPLCRTTLHPRKRCTPSREISHVVGLLASAPIRGCWSDRCSGRSVRVRGHLR